MTAFTNTLQNGLKQWWWFLVIGILGLAAGIAILAKPTEGYLSLSIFFSFIMAGTGFSQIIFALSARSVFKGWGWSLTSGILDLCIGTFLMIYPTVTMTTLPFFVGFYLAFRGFYLMGTSLDLRMLGMSYWGWLFTGGLLLLVLGFLTLYRPVVGAFGIVVFSGIAFIISGISSMFLGFKLKDFKSDLEHFSQALQTKTEVMFGHAATLNR